MQFNQIDASELVGLTADEIDEVSGAIVPLVAYAAIAVGTFAVAATVGYYANRDRTPRRR